MILRPPQPWSSALKRLSILGAFIFFAQLLAPARAGAVQLFIESAFVHAKNANCVVEVFNGVPRFRCPPITPVPPDPASGTGGSDACTGVAAASCTDLCLNNPAPNRCPSVGPCDPTLPGCNQGVQGGIGNQYGNISNDPEINFDTELAATTCRTRMQANGVTPGNPAPLVSGDTINNICNASVFLCAGVGYGNDDTTSNPSIAIDSIEFEVFKFLNGTNPNDSGSAPPLRTYFIDAPGVLPSNSTSASDGPLGPFCVLWDGSYNIQGSMGKTNGIFGFRGTVLTNQTGASGNIQISAVRSYPSGATFDGLYGGGSLGNDTAQQPLLVNVNNVHVISSSPTLVGNITPIPAQPYNIFYRLSKDATMYITIEQPNDPLSGVGNPLYVRTVLNGQARVGEGIPAGSLSNGDSWNGRADNGDLMPSGAYLATLQAFSRDQWGDDLSVPTTVQMGLDPLQITDIRVTPLSSGSTSLAVLAYVLTEPATVFIDIYPPGVQFCPVAVGASFVPPLVNLSQSALDQLPPLPPKNLNPSLGDCAGNLIPANPVKRIQTQQNARVSVVNFWDARDQTGNEVPDGDYVFVIYAALPSQNGFLFNGGSALCPTATCTDRRIWTSTAKSGFIVIDRGFVGISQVQPQSAILGSSPAVAGLNPFRFSYSLSRDAIVNMAVFDGTGQRMVRHLVVNETRPGNGFPNTEVWPDGTDDNGLMVSSGTYLIQLTATDPNFPTMVSTTTALFPVDLWRIADLNTVPILGGASDFVLVSYQLSQPMFITLNIYSPGTVIVGSSATWPPCLDPAGGTCSQVLTSPAGVPGSAPAVPITQIKGLRTGRLRITEQWDGRDVNGLTIPDGQYVYTLLAISSTTPTYFASDRTYGTVVVNRGLITINPFTVTPDIPTMFASSETITLHPYTIAYSVNRQSSVTIQILNTSVPPAIVRNIIVGQVRQNGILLQETWDGRDTFGNFPPSGFYLVRAFANDVASQLNTPATAQVTIGYDPLRIYDVAVTPLSLGQGGSSIFFQVSEPMKVAVKIYRPGTSFDLQQNPSPPDGISLVKRIIGTEPARVQIEDVWDGTDFTFTKVPDGTYKFLIVGSTASAAIDNVTGNILNYSALADDKVVDDLPVVRNGSLDPTGDFERNSFVYPNPVTAPSATISIYSPMQADIKLDIYNVAGQLVLQQDLGQVAPSYIAGNTTYVWAKANQAGRTVARGIYFVVVRLEDTLGGKTVLQTVKRVLIP